MSSCTDKLPAYASIVVRDTGQDQVGLVVCAPEGLDQSCFLSLFAGMVLHEIESSKISPELAYDSEGDGEIMLVFEDNGCGVSTELLANPPMTLSEGKLTPAQALAISALQRVEERIGLGSFENTSIYSRESL